MFGIIAFVVVIGFSMIAFRESVSNDAKIPDGTYLHVVSRTLFFKFSGNEVIFCTNGAKSPYKIEDGYVLIDNFIGDGEKRLCYTRKGSRIYLDNVLFVKVFNF